MVLVTALLNKSYAAMIQNERMQSPFNAAAPRFWHVTVNDPAPGITRVTHICASFAPKLAIVQIILEAAVHTALVTVKICDAADAVTNPVNTPTPTLASTVTAAAA